MQCTDLNEKAGLDDVSITIPIINALGDKLDLTLANDVFVDVFLNKEFYKRCVNNGDTSLIHFTVGDSSINFICPKGEQPIGEISISLTFNFSGIVGNTARDVTEYNSNLFEIINFYE